MPFRIEGECEPPNTVSCVEAQLLHLRMARSMERVHARPPKLRPKDFEHRHVCQEFVLDRLRQGIELGHELSMELDGPSYIPSCLRIHMESSPCPFLGLTAQVIAGWPNAYARRLFRPAERFVHGQSQATRSPHLQDRYRAVRGRSVCDQLANRGDTAEATRCNWEAPVRQCFFSGRNSGEAQCIWKPQVARVDGRTVPGSGSFA